MAKEFITVKIVASQALAKPDGAAIGLTLSVGQAIAFEVDQQAIDALRRDLAEAEQILHRLKKPGQA